MSFSVVRILIFGLHAVAANANEGMDSQCQATEGGACGVIRLDMLGDLAKSYSDGKFPFVHWLWQHSIFRFQAAKLASGTIAAEDLATAWELHHKYAIAAHTQYELEMLFPAVKLLKGGEAAIATLEEEEKNHTKSAQQIEQALQDGKGDAQALIKAWANARVAHATSEEDLIVPLVRSQMSADAKKAHGQQAKEFSKAAPGSKMALCLFRDLSYVHPVIGEQYVDSFPWFLRYVLIPSFSLTNGQYKEHKRIFGSIAP